MDQYRIKRSSGDLIGLIKRNDEKGVEALLLEGINVNARDNDEVGMVALHHAIFANNVQILKLLLEHGAYPDDATYGGIRPFDVAFALTRVEHLHLLIHHGARVNIKLFELYRCNKLPRKFGQLFYTHVELRDRDKHGCSILHKVVKYGDVEGLKTILRRGAAVDERTLNDGMTSLHIAARNGHQLCIEILLGQGAKPNLKDEFGFTALHLLMIASIPEVDKVKALDTLLDFGCDMNLTCNRKKTALHYAFKHRSVDSCINLMKHIAKIHHNQDSISNYNMQFITSNERLSTYYVSCLDELDKIKVERMSPKITLYQLLMYNIRELLQYTRAFNDYKCFKSQRYNNRYPIYYENLERKFHSLVENRKLLDSASMGLCILIKRIDSNSIITQKILGFLKTEDLKSLALICEWNRARK
ncbi:PREDICTED: serine/threonine-protein phosphatase 6 regulatory ankyrin repeat subunit B-like [Ceratosolen solmsi marchali]|uniref:Serine/threonine-protein phosphatase 6 regulatory ankyrin repeat subunit B-like n=1 Tax=Ceratosolen solmsi marchali TaxID=326594 RepID=A0AAJ6YE41_9HYME|nr:PREDICTED: serine/threonine-protein phosphatase 6 regulatory ankyrin repeat subunit B-like [Ceratosolen solmsi marchali]